MFTSAVIQLLLLALSLALLVKSADWFVELAVTIANKMGIATLTIGVFVIGFGTSAPEIIVSFISSLQGKSSLAVGNVIGSNIANIALVLGFCMFASSHSSAANDFKIRSSANAPCHLC